MKTNETREIRFRAWDIVDKKMYSPFRITDCLGEASGEVWFGNPKKDLDRDIMNHTDCIIMQYTGLKDKNGVDIYEGDVIENGWSKESNNHFSCEIRWDNERSSYSMPSDYNDEVYVTLAAALEEDSWSVSGNIYQNPELLQIND